MVASLLAGISELHPVVASSVSRTRYSSLSSCTAKRATRPVSALTAHWNSEQHGPHHLPPLNFFASPPPPAQMLLRSSAIEITVENCLSCPLAPADEPCLPALLSALLPCDPLFSRNLAAAVLALARGARADTLGAMQRAVHDAVSRLKCAPAAAAGGDGGSDGGGSGDVSDGGSPAQQQLASIERQLAAKYGWMARMAPPNHPGSIGKYSLLSTCLAMWRTDELLAPLFTLRAGVAARVCSLVQQLLISVSHGNWQAGKAARYLSCLLVCFNAQFCHMSDTCPSRCASRQGAYRLRAGDSAPARRQMVAALGSSGAGRRQSRQWRSSSGGSPARHLRAQGRDRGAPAGGGGAGTCAALMSRH